MISFISILSILLIITSFASADDNAHLPQGGVGEIIHHFGFTLQYDDEREQALWVAYELTKEEVLASAVQRSDDFREDPEVDLGSAKLLDYVGSGFDRGHLAPANDLAWSEDAMSDSFYLSNMTPQEPSFNRGIWKKLEAKVRGWACEYDKVYVVSGSLYLFDRGAIGASHVDIPSHYYKVIYDMVEPEIKAIALVLENKASNVPLQHHVISIDRLEKVSGLDFLSQLPDDLENDLEKDAHPEAWSWSSMSSQNYQSISANPFDESISSHPSSSKNYWISVSGKRHNTTCRYYKNCKGQEGSSTDGLACKSCGG